MFYSSSPVQRIKTEKLNMVSERERPIRKVCKASNIAWWRLIPKLRVSAGGRHRGRDASIRPIGFCEGSVRDGTLRSAIATMWLMTKLTERRRVDWIPWEFFSLHELLLASGEWTI